MACINDNPFSSKFDIDSDNDNFFADINRTYAHNGKFINNLNNTIDVTDGDSNQLPVIYIISQQDALMPRFGQLILNESDEISIDLFHMPNASNNSLIMIDRIISWLKMREGNISSNDSKDFIV